MRYILIDDERNVLEVNNMLQNINLDNHFEFDTVFRTFHEAIAGADNISCLDTVFLDHDLGTDEPGIDGHGVIKHFRDTECFPACIIIVSANPIGLRNIESVLLNDMNYKKTADRMYIKKADKK
jgi:hypothetical protein